MRGPAIFRSASIQLGRSVASYITRVLASGNRLPEARRPRQAALNGSLDSRFVSLLCAAPRSIRR